MAAIIGMPNQAIRDILNIFGLKGKKVYKFKLVMNVNEAAYIEVGMYPEGEQIEKLKSIMKRFEIREVKS